MKLKAREKQVIVAMADNNMCQSKAARSIHVYRTLIDYYHHTILDKTGLSIHKFRDLQKLLAMVEGT